MQVAEVLPEYASVFSFDAFNRMQAAVVPALLDRTENAVVSAPTGSGKTALAEVALIQAIDRGEMGLFIAPMRALTSEKAAEWERFETAGYDVRILTGEDDLSAASARSADILVVTPEKLDSVTRNSPGIGQNFLADVGCCVIDEVQLLDSPTRGPALEVTIDRLRQRQDPRIVALSATMANIEDVASWLDAPPGTTFDFDDSYRPVDLETTVVGYNSGDNSYHDRYRRLFAATDQIQPHLEGDGQAIIFVSTRQGAQSAAKKCRDIFAEEGLGLGHRGEYDRHTDAQSFENETLRDLAIDGIGFHHAGLSNDDRSRVEAWFRDGTISVLVATTTLAWGVNLPARCVVIRDLHFHHPDGDEPIRQADLLQMLGRAGRPGYDDKGYGVLVAETTAVDRYRDVLDRGAIIHSHLDEELAEHCNAAIAAGHVETRSGAIAWLARSFWAIQSDITREECATVIDSTLSTLEADGFIDTTDCLKPRELGTLTARSYLSLETAITFRDHLDRARGSPGAIQACLLSAVISAAEFDDIVARADEHAAIEAACGPDPTTDDLSRQKVRAVLEGTLEGSIPSALADDAWTIRQTAARLMGTLTRFARAMAPPAVSAAAATLEARIDGGYSAEMAWCARLHGVGTTLAERLERAEITTPATLREQSTQDLVEVGLNRSLAQSVLDQAERLPAITVDWDVLPAKIDPSSPTVVDVPIENEATGSIRVALTVFVDDTEMSTKETTLGQTTIPIALCANDRETVSYELEVVFPHDPFPPQHMSVTRPVVLATP